MALTVYPSTPKPAYSYIVDHQFKTIGTDFDSGEENANRRWRFPKRIFNLTYKFMEFNATQRDPIYEFFQNRLGSYEPFWFFDVQSRKWVDQRVGEGNGIEDTFDLPGNGTISAVYIDAVVNTDYTFSDNTGEGGADQIIFDSPPANGAVITANFTGYLRIKGRFKDDKLTEEIVTRHFDNFSVSIYEIITPFGTVKVFVSGIDTISITEAISVVVT